MPSPDPSDEQSARAALQEARLGGSDLDAMRVLAQRLIELAEMVAQRSPREGLDLAREARVECMDMLAAAPVAFRDAVVGQTVVTLLALSQISDRVLGEDDVLRLLSQAGDVASTSGGPFGHRAMALTGLTMSRYMMKTASISLAEAEREAMDVAAQQSARRYGRELMRAVAECAGGAVELHRLLHAEQDPSVQFDLASVLRIYGVSAAAAGQPQTGATALGEAASILLRMGDPASDDLRQRVFDDINRVQQLYPEVEIVVKM